MNISLKDKLAQGGFEANVSYDHVVKCFLNTPNEYVRCLDVDGDCGRHKTAFAYALAQALGNKHVLYFEFGLDSPVLPSLVRVVDGEEVIAEPPVAELDKMLNEICALSEAESTVLILDQLQQADFKQHIRLQAFMKSAVWQYGEISCYANKDNLQLYLVSDGGLSSMLQQVSFRVWLPQQDQAITNIRSMDVGLPKSCDIWLAQLIDLMNVLEVTPSLTEYQYLAYEIEAFVRTDHQLKASIMGRVKGVDYLRLNSQIFTEAIAVFMRSYENSLYVQETIEIKADLSNL